MYQSSPLPEKFARFLAHWQALRADAHVPTLADFLDKPLPQLQPWISIFDVVENNLVLRLVGTSMVQFIGRDFTGTTLEDFAAPDGREEIRSPYLKIIQQPCGGLASTLWATSHGRDVEIRSIGLPLVRKSGASVAWFNEPARPMDLGEKGVVVRRRMSQEWVDIGFGIPV
jgi:hypothetical protein